MPFYYRHSFFLSSLSVLTMPFAEAQTNFRAGYMLPLAGDTLRGEVDSREGRINARRFRFRSAPEPTISAPPVCDFTGCCQLTLPSRRLIHARAQPLSSLTCSCY